MHPDESSGYPGEDLLGHAAELGTRATAAADSGDFDGAWRILQEVCQLYMLHAQRNGFTQAQTLALVGTTHRGMARLLRQEGRHHDALSHWLYSAACTSSDSEKELKLYRPFVNRCKFRSVSLDEVASMLRSWMKHPDLRSIQRAIDEWKARDRR